MSYNDKNKDTTAVEDFSVMDNSSFEGNSFMDEVPAPEKKSFDWGNYGSTPTPNAAPSVAFDPIPDLASEPAVQAEPVSSTESAPKKVVEEPDIPGPLAPDDDSSLKAVPVGENLLENKPKKKKKKSASSAPAQSHNEKKLKKKTKNGNRSGVIVAKCVLYFVFAVIIILGGLDRIQSAQALIGTAEIELPQIQQDVTSSPNYRPVTPEEEEKIPGVYEYISPDHLGKKTMTDLAIWYMTEFPEGKAHNEDALDEFNEWLIEASKADPDFSKEYAKALDYVKAHPELLLPPEPEPEPEEEEDKDGTGSSGGATTEEPERFFYIDEDEMNKMSAAQVSNWVTENFPVGGTNWNYQELTEYYIWMETTKSAEFIAQVNGFLQVKGWNTYIYSNDF